jgi:chemotaxis methyl-accepting protein methylase
MNTEMRMDMDMQHELGHTALTWTCSIDMEKVWTWACSMGTEKCGMGMEMQQHRQSMLNVHVYAAGLHVHAAGPCPYCIYMPMLHVHVNSA